MKKALMLVADPKIPGTVPRYGMHLSAGRDQSEHAADLSFARIPTIDIGAVRPYRNKSSILEIGSSIRGERPNSPSLVLKERLHPVSRQSTIGDLAHIEFFLLGAAVSGLCASSAVNRDLPVIPSFKTVRRAEPNAAVLRRQNGPYDGIRQTLLHGNRGDGEVAKAVETIK